MALFSSMRRAAIVAAVIGTTVGWAGVEPARAGSVASFAPEQVLGLSDSIFEGVVESVRAYRTRGERGPIATEYSVRIARVLRDEAGELARRTVKGKGGDGRVTLKFAGGKIGDVEETLHGVPTFTVGQRSFFFINKRDWDATSPIMGVHQGLFRVESVAGKEQVTRAGGCCERPQAVKNHFFANMTTAPEGFSADQFAEEIARGLAIVKQRPDLKWDKLAETVARLGPSDHDASTIGSVSAGHSAGLANRDVASQPPLAYDGTPHELPPAMKAAERVIVDRPDDQSIVTPARPTPQIGDRFGFFRNSPSLFVTFNVAPNMNAFGTKFQEMMSYWNAHADIFRVYVNNTNSIEDDNDRNEAGFVTSAGLTEQLDHGWNTAEYAVCHTISRGGRIEESDIYFNIDAGMTWTNDYAGAAAQSLASPNCMFPCNNLATYFPSVALHELGHSFGMEHQWIPSPSARFPSIMNYYPKNRLYDTAYIFADDAAGITSRYAGLPRTNGLIKLWYNDGTVDTNSNGTRWTIPSGQTINRGTALAIGSGTRYFTIDNTGSGSISPTVDFYLTPSWGSWTDAIYLGTANPAAISARASAQFQRSVTIPATVTPGAYYVAAFMTVAGDQDGNDNSTWSYDRITVAAAPPSNDSPAGATVMTSRGGFYTGTTYGATYSQGGQCGSSSASPDVWFRITPAHNGSLDLNTCGSAYDTVLELFNSGMGNMGCDDDAVSGPCAGTRNSRLIRTVTGGQNYFIRVSGFNRAVGNFNLSARLIPANDTCTVGQFLMPSATVTAGTTVFGTTIGATATPGGLIPPCPFQGLFGSFSIENNPDVWYNYTAPCSGPTSVLVYSNQTLQPAVYSGCYDGLSVFSPTLVACAEPTFGSFNHVASFNAVAGHRYAIRVTSVTGMDDFALSVVATIPDDPCGGLLGGPAPIDVAVDVPAVQVCDTRCANPSSGGLAPAGCGDAAGEFDMGNDLYYTLNILSSGRLDITRCNGSYLPAVALYASCPDANPQQPVACGFSNSPSCDPILLTHNVTAGQSFILRVGGNPAAQYGPEGVTTLTFTVTSLVDPTLGACCEADGTCNATTEADCAAAYQGDATVCDPNPCPLPTNSCCQIDGTCAATASADCAGAYQGDGTVCDPNPCPQPVGACCVNGECSSVSMDECAALAGTYFGEGTPCLGDVANPITCCVANFNGEGGVTVQDVFDFLNAYFTGDIAADVNGSGDVTIQDIFDYLNGYFRGCN